MNGILTVVGAGPAGSSAAIAALLEGASVTLHEKSRFPRHKVCGEFLSPEIVPLLHRLGVWPAIAACRPARFRRLALHFPKLTKTAAFADPPYGFSRYRLDQILLDRALSLGARLEASHATGGRCRPLVIAHGRSMPAPRSPGRLFGFKAHYTGPPSDAIELFFFDQGYVGVNAVEDGFTNVCGLATQELLDRHGFQPDSLVAAVPALRRRLANAGRSMEWLHTGPLVYSHRWQSSVDSQVYLAGDALSFVDPFTGTGILSAVLTGSLAGRCAARGISSADHLRACRKALRRAFLAATTFRWLLATPLAPILARYSSGNLLVRLTRPKVFREWALRN